MEVAYMTDADLLAGSGYSPSDYWTHQLTDAPLTLARTGQQSPLTEPRIVSAASFIRNPLCGTDWIAAGDASVALDPLSGQGIYNALEGGSLAAKAIIARLDADKDEFIKYSNWINSLFSDYLQMRSKFYSREQRWRQCPFWRRRQSL
jgi:flavin-dependent dehydrogenase